MPESIATRAFVTAATPAGGRAPAEIKISSTSATSES